MSSESDFIAALRTLATHPAARGLADDAAVLELGGGQALVLTHDMIVEGVHYLPSDPPDEVAWKLLAVNLSDLAAKGARPLGVLLGYTLGEGEWDRAFAAGLGTALSAFGVPLLGGDTVSASRSRVLGLTAIGAAPPPVPSRSGAAAGDILWVSGTIGDSGAGLEILQGGGEEPEVFVRRYRAPRPRLEAGQRLAALATAMMDLSDGLLIDAAKLGEASGMALQVELDSLPLSAAYIGWRGEDREARLAAATAGDDYELLFTASAEAGAEILAISEALGLPLSRIGRAEAGAGLTLVDADGPVPLPSRLGFEHRA